MAKIRKTLKLFFQKFKHYSIMKESAALAYYSVLATAPLIMISFYLLTKVEPQHINKLIPHINLIMGSTAAELFKTIIDSAGSGKVFIKAGSKVIGFLILILSASSIFNQINILIYKLFNGDRVLNKKETIFLWIKSRAISVLLLLILIIGIISSFTISILKNFLITMNQEANYWSFQSLFFVMLTLFFFGVFRVFKSKNHSLWQCLTGSLITASGFAIGKVIITLYLKTTALTSVYGLGSSVILLLLWSYYSSLIFLSGSLLTSLLPEFKKIFKNQT